MKKVIQKKTKVKLISNRPNITNLILCDVKYNRNVLVSIIGALNRQLLFAFRFLSYIGGNLASIGSTLF